MPGVSLRGARGGKREGEGEDVHLDIGGLEDAYARGARGEQVGGGDEGGDNECDSGEEAKCVLEADDGGVHGRRWVGAVATALVENVKNWNWAPGVEGELAGVTWSSAGKGITSLRQLGLGFWTASGAMPVNREPCW